MKIKKQFETLEEVLTDPICADFVAKKIEILREQRQVAHWNSTNGLKRTAFNTLDEKGMLYPNVMIQETKRIIDKTSTLPSRERLLIELVVHEAAMNTVKHYKQPAK